MRIIPAIDILNGECVRLLQGNYSKKTMYEPDPVTVARKFERLGFNYLHVVDLDGAKSGAVKNWAALQKICQETNLSVDFGGGIRNKNELSRLFDLGVSQVNLGSIAVNEPRVVAEWMEEFGTAKIIISADVRDNKIAFAGWQKDSSSSIEDFLEALAPAGIEYVTCTDISRDGTLQGPNVDLYRQLHKKFPLIKLIASGGVGSLSDIENLRSSNVEAVIVGKAIYENKIRIEDLIGINQ